MTLQAKEKQCVELISKLNESALSTVLMLLDGVADQERHLRTTPAERVQEIEEKIKKRDEAEREAWRKECKAREERQKRSEENFKQAQEELQQWIDKKPKGVKVPPTYDLTGEDMATVICGLDIRKHDLVWDAIEAVYRYGFKRGCNYTKAKAKKKAITHDATNK